MGVVGLSIPPKVNAQRQELVIRAVHVYKKDIRVIRHPKRRRSGERKPVWLYDTDGTVITNQSLNDGKVTEFSRKSRQHLAFVAQNTESNFDRMITLTYPSEYPLDGKVCKKQLNVILQWLRRRKIESYLWFLEFQKRGAPHFHILIEGGEFIDRVDLAERWFHIVGSGDIKHLNAGTRIEAGRTKRGLHKYAVKYASKIHQKNVPVEFGNVGRLWGCSYSVNPKPKAVIPVDCEESLTVLLGEWEYIGEEKKGYHILFNASPHVLATLEKAGITPEYISGVGGKENDRL